METIDDSKVEVATDAALKKSGSRLLQIHRFSESDEEHVAKLLEIFSPVQGCRIADVGCGVGELAKMMKAKRPDLKFILINKSKSQLKRCPKEFKQLEGIAEELPLVENEVDAIMVTYALGHFDLKKFIKECARVLPIGGFIYIYDFLRRDIKIHPCHISEDLNYNELFAGELISEFGRAGFNHHPARFELAPYVPVAISELMPNSRTLRNTQSATMVFQKYATI